MDCGMDVGSPASALFENNDISNHSEAYRLYCLEQSAAGQFAGCRPCGKLIEWVITSEQQQKAKERLLYHRTASRIKKL